MTSHGETPSGDGVGANVEEVTYTLFADKLGRTAERRTEPWAAFIERLRNIAPQQRKHGQLVKFALFGPRASDKGNLRHNANVELITGIEGDYDAGVMPPEGAAELLFRAGIKAVVVTTWSHTPGLPRWRVFAPLSVPLAPERRKRLVEALNDALGGVLGSESFTLSQSFFVGRRAGAEYRVFECEGKCVDEIEALPSAAARPSNGSHRGGATSAIPEGQRHATLVSLAGSMRRRGMTQASIEAALQAENEARCNPPLDPSEVGAIATSVARYEPEAENPVRFEDFYAYMPNHSYIFRPTRELWPAASVNAQIGPFEKGHAKKDGDPEYEKASARLDRTRHVEQMTWSPGEGEVIQGRLIEMGGWIERPGCSTYNLYRPPTIELGDPAKAERWIEHTHRVFSEEAGYLIRWLAHRRQRPHEKINHAIVLQGDQGTGKDTIIEGAIPAVGAWNVRDVSPDQVMGRFNGWLKSVILRVSEARDLGETDRFRFYDHMKTYTAAPPTVLMVDEKHLREIQVPNVTGVAITTNHRDGIFLPADDRRHYVARTQLTKDEFSKDYFKELYRWYASEGCSHIAAYLDSLDLSEFDPKAPPPKTAAFWDLVDAGRAPEDGELAELLDKLNNPPAVTLADLIDKAVETFESNFDEWLRDRRNSRQIPHRMEAVGYVPVRNDAAKDGRWKVYGRGVVIYARRELNIRDRIEAAGNLARGAR